MDAQSDPSYRASSQITSNLAGCKIHEQLFMQIFRDISMEDNVIFSFITIIRSLA